MTVEVRDLTNVVNHLKEGRYNEIESGKFLTEEEIRRLRGDLEAVEREREELRRENAKMRAESEKVGQYQSAYLSN
jgi:peptidoglycan hydrolase CwlO-like protein